MRTITAQGKAKRRSRAATPWVDYNTEGIVYSASRLFVIPRFLPRFLDSQLSFHTILTTDLTTKKKATR